MGVTDSSSAETSASQIGRDLRFAIFIVAYNAVTTLRKLLDRIPQEAWEQVEEVYVFDDCSQDDTALLGEGYKAAKGVGKLRIYRNDFNLGYGGNQKRGYAYALEKGFDYVILLHGDGQYAPEMIPDFIAQAKEKRPAAVFGSRMLKRGEARRGGMPLYKYLGNRILTIFENLLLGSRLSEFHSGYRMYSTSALSKLHLSQYTDDFHFDTQVIVELLHHGFEIVEIPIPTYYGDEICYVNGVKYAKDVAFSVLQYKLGCLALARCDWCRGAAGVRASRYPAKRSGLSSHRRVASLVPPNARVLGVGAEANYAAELTAKGCKVTGLNSSDPGGRIVGLYEHFVIADADAGLPEPQDLGTFDCVVMADVLEHLKNAPAVLSRAKDLLNSQGIVIASTGNVAHWYVRLNLLLGRFNYAQRGILDAGHLHLYTRRSFKELLEKQGYQLLRVKVTPIPFELLAGRGAFSSALWKTVEYAYYIAARAWPGLFAYQFILIATPARKGP
jgi:glycosyltransferase involved in cell wall biosynthesis/SAM-dependent methyltransferase